MLIYNPIFDLYHCVFRQMQILSNVKDEISFEKLRILDFYLAFPTEILRMRLPKEASKYRKYFRQLENPYEIIIDHKRLFSKMEPYQISANKFLLASGLIEKGKLGENFVKRTNQSFPSELATQIELRNKENELLLNIITQFLMKTELNGPDGLKARTNIMEYKYDLS